MNPRELVLAASISLFLLSGVLLVCTAVSRVIA